MKEHRLSANIVFLYFLTAAKIIFPLLTFPYLTRVLSIETYGLVSYVRATISYMQLFVEFGFGLSAVKDIARLYNNKIQIGIVTGNVIVAKIILCAVSFIVYVILCQSIEVLRYNILFDILSFLVVVLSVFLLDFLFRGIEEMQLITISFVIMKGISTALTFVFVHDDGDILWIPTLDIVSSLIAILFVVYAVKKQQISIKMSTIRDVFIALKRSFIYFLSNMATSAFGALNTVLIGIYITDIKDVAYWTVALTFIYGVQALYSPIINGIYPQMAKKPSLSLLRKITSICMPCVVIGCVITFFFATDIVRIVNGPNYDKAAYLLCLMIPVIFFSFPGMLIGWPTLGAIDKAKEVTKTTIFACVFQIAGLGLLILTNMFNLIAIAILRDMTEAVLFLSRFGYFVKFKNLFVK